MDETTEPGWRGFGSYMGPHQEACDAQLFAIMRSLHHLASHRRRRELYTISSNSQAAMRRVQSDAPGPGQDIAMEIIDLSRAPRDQDNYATIRWVPGHRNVEGNELGNQFARAAESQRRQASGGQYQPLFP